MARSLILALILVGLPVYCHAQWTDQARLTFSSGESNLSGARGHPLQATVSGDVHVVWHDYGSGGSPQIYWRKFSGVSGWGLQKKISLGNGPATEAAAALSPDGTLHVFWRDGRSGSGYAIYYRALSQSGVWDISDTLIVPLAIYSSNYTAASDLDGNIFLFWSDTREGWRRVYCKRKLALTGWESGDTCVSDNPDGTMSTLPSATNDKFGNVHVVWSDDRVGNWEVYYRLFTKNAGWDPQVTRITRSVGLSIEAGIACDGLGNVHIIWGEDRVGNISLFYKKKSLGAPQWGPERMFILGSGDATSSSIVADQNGNVFVAWEDKRNLGIGSEIYFRAFTADEGLDSSETRITVNFGTSWGPALASDGAGNLHLIWADNSDGNFEIYYARGKGMSAVEADGLELSAVPMGDRIALRWEVGGSSSARELLITRRISGESASLVLRREIFGAEKGDYTDYAIYPGQDCEYEAVIRDQSGRTVASRLIRASVPGGGAFAVRADPGSGTVLFTFSGGVTGKTRFMVADVYGRVICSAEAWVNPGAGRFELTLPRERLVSGVYLAVFENGEKRIARKIVIVN